MISLSYPLKKLMRRLNAKEYFNLSSFTTIKIGGNARFFILINNLDDLKELQKALLDHEVKIHILGGGSNTLFSDLGFNGAVIKLGPYFSQILETKENSFKVGAAASFAKLTKICVNKSIKSAVGWAGTPGVVGGAVYMNAGSKLGEISDVVESISGLYEDKIINISKKDCGFSYRNSNLPKNFIITEVDIKAFKDDLGFKNDLLKYYEESKAKRKKTQPTINSAGSFFKNPYPNYAAKLIENCNLKGLQYGGAQISPMHANFIVNKGNATAYDVIELAKITRKTVFEEFGILLLPEILLAGEFDCKDPFMWH